MSPKLSEKMSQSLLAFVATLANALDNSRQEQAMQDYITGLLMNGEGKSMEPMAARLVAEPADRDAMRQRLQPHVSVSRWDDDAVRAELANQAESKMRDIEAFVIDDTGFAKKGTHSVGVARQYSGTLARVGNCQVATSLHLVSEASSVCIGMRLYLPKSWADDPERRKKAGVPEDVVFQKKWQIGLDLLDKAQAWGVPKRFVLSDSGYGDCVEFRQGLDSRELPYVVGISETTVVWRPGEVPQNDGEQEPGKPVSVATLAIERGRHGLSTVTWRRGSRGPQRSQFGFVRVHTAHGHAKGEPPGAEQWLIYEWPGDEDKPTKFWLSTLPADTSKRRLVRLAKLRWRVERDYQDMKQEVGLDDFQGRKWLGFHHHATLCMAAHAFLALNRVFFPHRSPKTTPAEDSV